MKRDYNRVESGVIHENGFSLLNCNCHRLYGEYRNGDYIISNTFNDNGELIYTKLQNIVLNEVTEEWWESDERGYVTYYKRIGPSKEMVFEEWVEYDEFGNEIHIKDSDGYERWNVFDENNILVSMRDNQGNFRFANDTEKLFKNVRFEI